MRRARTSVSHAASLFVAVAALALLGADCEGNVVLDPTFRDWCGNKLCSWNLDAGNIKRVPTWNENDFGVSFLDPSPTQISQVTDESAARCLLFTTVANIDPTAAVSLLVDFDNDGTPDRKVSIGAADWHRVQDEITAPPVYNGIRFAVLKEGTGNAVLAEMRIQSTTNCTAAPVILQNLSIGEECASDSECASGVCAAVGARLCGQCSDQRPCADGASCASRSAFLPMQCGPGLGLGNSGDPCVADNDCRSGSCQGAKPVSLLADGGACNFNQPLGADNCSWYFVVGGKCL
jgi:hypothetical protein